MRDLGSKLWWGGTGIRTPDLPLESHERNHCATGAAPSLNFITANVHTDRSFFTMQPSSKTSTSDITEPFPFPRHPCDDVGDPPVDPLRPVHEEGPVRPLDVHGEVEGRILVLGRSGDLSQGGLFPHLNYFKIRKHLTAFWGHTRMTFVPSSSQACVPATLNFLNRKKYTSTQRGRTNNIFFLI